MKIVLTKGESRHRLMCIRTDGTTTQSSVNDQLPAHDLAHYVVESHLGFKAGFYGNIAAGYSIEDLSDKQLIATLPQQSMVAEVLTRALQGMAAPEAKAADFLALTSWELEVLQLPIPTMTSEQVVAMAAAFRTLLQRWKAMSYGGELEMIF